MACMTVSYQSGRIGQFKGDGAGLVDCLIKACEQRPVSSSVSSSFGRELVPWSDDSVFGVELAPLEDSGRRVGNAHSATTKAGARAGSAHKALNNKRSRASGSPRSGSPRSARPTGTKQAPSNGFACPALAAAPKPHQIPMPTFSLISRATGKDVAPASFFHAGQLVRPVAA